LSSSSRMGQVGKRRIEKISETLARDILHDILDRGLTTGARLPSEAELVASYGVGKSSLREALRLLEVNGVITIKTGPTGGPIVAESSPVEFAKMSVFYFRSTRVTFGELIEARIMMESMMAGLAATRRDSQTDLALRESLALT
jgi:GntR family transcriptional repressor for pyruvate dehydrogenase complex